MLQTQIRTAALLLVASLVVACGRVGDAPEAKSGEAVTVSRGAGSEYRIDTTRSTIAWKAAKVTRAHDGGFRSFAGTLSVNGDSVTAVHLTIQTASIFTDNEKLTGHLRSPDFFKVEQFPTATFDADRFVRLDSGEATHMVTGNLALLGQTRAVTFPARISVAGTEARAHGDFIINRKDWGIVYPGAPDDLIGDDVRLILDITAVGGQPVSMR